MFDYFKLGENEQFLFLQLPLLLIKDDLFKELSSDAKILYSLMLNRTSLSAKSGWVDDNDNIYIVYTIEQMMDDLNCWQKKATKAIKELKDIGLVRSVRVGLGKPNIIYVMNFATFLKDEINPINTASVLNCQNDNSGLVKTTILDLSKRQSNNIDYININNINKKSKSCQSHNTETNTEDDMTMTVTYDKQKYDFEK